MTWTSRWPEGESECPGAEGPANKTVKGNLMTRMGRIKYSIKIIWVKPTQYLLFFLLLLWRKNTMATHFCTLGHRLNLFKEERQGIDNRPVH